MHPEVVHVAELAARIIGLDVCGVNIVTTDVRRPLRETGGGIVEVNAAPGFRMHTQPTEGRPRNVAVAVVDSLFPEQSEGRIPVAAVTGTNGKTTTTRLIGHICLQAGRHPGMTTTDGIVVDGWTLKPGDMAGPRSAKIVLGIPTVDTAVLEVARGGILREGLGYDYNDVAVVTNVSGDHLGLSGIETVEDLARVKRVIVEAVPRSGTAVLNADDRLVAGMASQCRGRVAYTTTSLDPRAPGRRRVLTSFKEGALGGIIEGIVPDAAERGAGRLVVRRGSAELIDLSLGQIPLTWDGNAWINVANAMQAACAAIALGIAPDDVVLGLTTFVGDLEHGSGRLNRFSVHGREVIFDYAHNPAALRGLADVIGRVRGDRRVIGVMSVPGDRRSEDKVACGEIAGRMFDELVVCEPNLRGLRPHETADILVRAAGVPHGYAPDEVGAALEALRRSREGELMVMCVDNVRAVHAALNQHTRN